MPSQKPHSPHKKPLANLNKHDIEKMAETLQKQYGVTIFETADGFWTLEFAFDDVQRYGIETMRRILKVWRNVSDCILFVQQNCSNASSVYMEFRGWTFAKEN